MIARIASSHDRSRVSVIGYGMGNLASSRNTPFRNRFDQWSNIQDMDPYTFAALVGNSDVDVLVDLGGLDSPDALAGFPLHAAPVQALWLGSPHGAPAEGYDFQLIDDLAPPSEDVRGAKAQGLSSGLLSMLLPPVPPPMAAPSDQRGFVAFGADAILGEINAGVVETWARIFRQVPDSQLFLRDHEFTQSENVNRLLNLFGNHGMAHRIEVVEAEQRRDFLDEIDILLAPFPHANPFAVGEALGHGLPVVALELQGRACADVARMARRLDLGDDMVASSEGDYVAKAVRWGTDSQARQAWRTNAFSTLADKPAFNVNKFVTVLEDAYLAMRKSVNAG